MMGWKTGLPCFGCDLEGVACRLKGAINPTLVRPKQLAYENDQTAMCLCSIFPGCFYKSCFWAVQECHRYGDIFFRPAAFRRYRFRKEFFRCHSYGWKWSVQAECA